MFIRPLPLGHPARPEDQLAWPQASGLDGWVSGLAGWDSGLAGWLRGGMDGWTNEQNRKSIHSTGLRPLSGPLPKENRWMAGKAVDRRKEYRRRRVREGKKVRRGKEMMFGKMRTKQGKRVGWGNKVQEDVLRERI